MRVEETWFPRFFCVQRHFTFQIGEKQRQLNGVPTGFSSNLLADFIGLCFLRAAVGGKDGALGEIADAADQIADC